MPRLDETGRGMQLTQVDGRGQMQLYQAIQVNGWPCVLVIYYAMPRTAVPRRGPAIPMTGRWRSTGKICAVTM